jgi:phage head maturation protease
LPVLATLEGEFAAEGLAVVAVCIGSSAEGARHALQMANADVRTLVDEDAETVLPYQVGGTPTTYLVDGAGVIVMSNVGYGDSTERMLRAEIERLLEE